MTLLEGGPKTKVAKAIAGGLWLGAALGSAFTVWNAGRFEAALPGLREKALLNALFTCGVSAPLGWAFWAGFIIKPDEAPAGGPIAS